MRLDAVFLSTKFPRVCGSNVEANSARMKLMCSTRGGVEASWQGAEEFRRWVVALISSVGGV